MKPADYAELGRLITLLHEDAISPDELERLEGLLRNNHEAQDFYHRYIALEVELGRSADLPTTGPIRGPSGELGPEGGERRPVVAESLPGPSTLPFVKPPSRRRLASLLIGAAAAAAGVLVAWTLNAWKPTVPDRPDPIEPAIVARLAELHGDVKVQFAAGEGVSAVAGQALVAGQTILIGGEESFAIVQYLDSTSLELHADTAVTLSDGRIALARGLLRAKVARQPKGTPLVVTTPHAEIRVLGTKLTAAIAPQATRVELEEGRVQLTRQSDGEILDVQAGSWTVVSRTSEALRSRPLPRQLARPRVELKSGAHQAAFAPDGKTMASAGLRALTFWDPLSGEKRSVLEGCRAPYLLAYSPDGMRLAVADKGPLAVKVWDLARQKPVPLAGPWDRGCVKLAFAPDGRRLATLDRDMPRARVRMWDAASGVELPALEAQAEPVEAIAFAPREPLLAAGTGAGKVIVWNWETARVVATFQGLRQRIGALAFSPDGKWLAIPGQENHGIKLWKVADQTDGMSFEGRGRSVLALTFSPDGNLLATGTNDGNVMLWNTATGEEVLSLRAGKVVVKSLAFSPDGRLLLTAATLAPVRLWDVASADRKQE